MKTTLVAALLTLSLVACSSDPSPVSPGGSDSTRVSTDRPTDPVPAGKIRVTIAIANNACVKRPKAGVQITRTATGQVVDAVEIAKGERRSFVLPENVAYRIGAAGRNDTLGGFSEAIWDVAGKGVDTVLVFGCK